jgi:hypothetical protein
MSKLDDACIKLKEEAKKIGVRTNDELLRAVAKGMGPALYKQDSSKVAFSDKAELERVKKNFAAKKLGVSDDAKLDKALDAIKEKFGASNRNKWRALVYYMLVKKFKKEDVYGL